MDSAVPADGGALAIPCPNLAAGRVGSCLEPADSQRVLGYVVGVDEDTASRVDMADFWVWLRTDRPRWIPSRRLLFIDEPRRTLWSDADERRSVAGCYSSALWYPIEITVLADVALDDGGAALQPPSLPPSPPTGDDGHCHGSTGRRGLGGQARHANGLDGGSVHTAESSTSAVPPAGTRTHVRTALAHGGPMVNNSCVAGVRGSLVGQVYQPFREDRPGSASCSASRVASCVAPTEAQHTVGSPTLVQLARW